MSTTKISKIKMTDGNIYQLTDTSKAPLDSAALTGTPTAPTPTVGDSSDRIATTAFVMAAMSGSIRITIIDGHAGLAATATLSDGSYSNTAYANASGIISIPVTQYGQYRISYSDYRCHGDNEAIVNTNIPVELSARYSEIIHYTLRIDETNSNPETSCVYLNDAAGMTKGSSAWDSMAIFNDIRPCVFQNGQVNYYLNPNNFSQKFDGSSSDLTGTDGDVMIEFRKFGYKITRDGNYLFIDLTNDDDPNYCYDAFSRLTSGDLSKFYQGAYKGYIDTNGDLRSIIGVQPTANKNIGQFRAAAQQRNTVNGVDNIYHYQQAIYAHLVALQCLYLMKYGTRNGQAAVGKGVVSITDDGSSNLSILTGGTEDKGMDWGDKTGGTSHMKLFGIEDFWGNIWEWIDGLTTDASWNIITSWNTFSGEPVDTPTSTITPSGLTANGSGWNKIVSGNSQTGFMPVQWGGSSSTFWADGGVLCASCVLYFGGGWDYGDIAGPFGLRASSGASISARSLGGRLSYQ